MVFKTTFEQSQRWSLSRRHSVQKTHRKNDCHFLNMLFKGELVLILGGLNSGILLYIKCLQNFIGKAINPNGRYNSWLSDQHGKVTNTEDPHKTASFVP